jgi:hypothetical protein
LDAGPLGQFNLPVTITPISQKTFFIDPTNGNDAFPGTSALPWKTVEKALDSSQDSGSTVKAAANAGNNVVVTILGGTNITQNVPAPGINTPALSAGSVTVLQASSPKTFTLNMNAVGSQLILNKGYKLQDIKITSSATGTAVKITHPTAGLASVDVKCTGTSSLTCVSVEGVGFHTLKDVRVDVTDAVANNTGILSDANANLSIIGGIVQPTGSTSNAITLIKSNGVLTVKDLTVDMTGGSTPAHTGASTGIVLNAPGSSVTGSIIYVNNASSSVKGIDVQAGPSTVKGNTFIGSGTNSVAITGGSNLSSGVTGALVNNNFSGTFSTSGAVQP